MFLCRIFGSVDFALFCPTPPRTSLFGGALYLALPKFVVGQVAFFKAAPFHLQYARGSSHFIFCGKETSAVSLLWKYFPKQ